MGRAWFSGFSAVFLAHLAWFGVIVAAARVAGLMPLVVILLLVFLNVAGLAAFLVARHSPRHRLPLALTMAPLTAVLGTASNLLFPFAGTRVDITGFYTDAGLFASLLLYGVFASIVGGLIGIWANGKRSEEFPVAVSTAPAATEALPEISVAPAPTAADLPHIRSD